MALAAGDGNERGHHADERALAGAVGAEQAEDFAFGDGEADALDGLEIAVALDDVFHGDAPGGAGRAFRRSLIRRDACVLAGAAHCFTSLLLGM